MSLQDRQHGRCQGRRYRSVLAVAASVAFTVGTSGAIDARATGGHGHPAGVPLDSAASGDEFEVVSHVDAGGFSSNVWVHDDIAYLGSFGQDASALPPGAPGSGGDVDLCPTTGIREYDISDSAQPELVGTYADGASEPDIDGTWNETVIAESVTTEHFDGVLSLVPFFACQAGAFQGFGLYDVTDPTSPQRLSTVSIPNPVFGMQEPWLDVRDDAVYVLTANAASELTTSPDGVTPGTPDLEIYDVSDPASPEKISEWGAWAELGIVPQGPDDNGVNRNRFVHTVYARDDIAYLSYFDNGTVMLDISDPAQPTFLGQTTFAEDEAGNAEHAWTSTDGNVLIQSSEHFPQESDIMPDLAGPSEWAWGYVRTYDVSDPHDPQLLGTLETPNTRTDPPPAGGIFYTPNYIRTQGDIAYFAWSGEGVVAADMSDPADPQIVAQFKTPATPDPFGFFMGGLPIVYTWGIAFHGDDLVVSDTNSGLWMLRLRSADEIPSDSTPAGTSPTDSPETSSHPFVIDATDGAFEMPAVIEGGVQALQFNNVGQRDHHAEIYQLPDGVDFATFFGALAQGPEAIDAAARAMSGPGTVEPGHTLEMQLALPPGRYVIMDVLPSEAGPPNFFVGMMREFIVQGGDPDAQVPIEGDPDIVLGDFTFVVTDSLDRGQNVSFLNAGTQNHEMTLIRLVGDETLDDAMAYFDELIPDAPEPGSGPPDTSATSGAPGPDAPPGGGPPPPAPPSEPPPFAYAGGLMNMAPGQSGTFVLDVEPGRYALICTVTDPATGQPHMHLGMVKEIEIE